MRWTGRNDGFEAFLLEVAHRACGDHSGDRRGAARKQPAAGGAHLQTAPARCTTRSKRRCLYLWLDHPDLNRENAILRSRLPGLPERLAAQVAGAVRKMRQMVCSSRPGWPSRWTGHKRCSCSAPGSWTWNAAAAQPGSGNSSTGGRRPGACPARRGDGLTQMAGFGGFGAAMPPGLPAQLAGPNGDRGERRPGYPGWSGSPPRCGMPGWRLPPTGWQPSSPRWTKLDVTSKPQT